MKYDVTVIKDRIKAEFKRQNYSIYKVLPTLDLSKNTLDSANKSMPKSDSLAKIADFLGVSVDYLLGRDVFNLTDAEHALLSCFRDCSEQSRAVLLDMALHYAEQERQAKEKDRA